MVEGRVFFGSLVSSVAVVILVVILGLRYLNGTLGGTYWAGSLLLSLVFAAVITVVLILSLTDWVRTGGGDARALPSGDHPRPATVTRRPSSDIARGRYIFYNSSTAQLA